MGFQNELLRIQRNRVYIASNELQEAVTVALALERPLLLKGVAKKLARESVVEALDRPLFTWHEEFQ